MTDTVFVLSDTSGHDNVLLGISTNRAAAFAALDLILEQHEKDGYHLDAWYHLGEYRLDEFRDKGAEPVRELFDGPPRQRAHDLEIEAEDQEREYRACQAAGLSWPSEMP